MKKSTSLLLFACFSFLIFSAPIEEASASPFTLMNWDRLSLSVTDVQADEVLDEAEAIQAETQRVYERRRSKRPIIPWCPDCMR